MVYDALVNKALLEHVRPGAERIDVGKRGAKHRFSQDQINTLLLEHVGKGKQVVRLKGGDPLLFGRGAEEAVFLGRHGVICRIVPGITAGLAAAAAAGIPVTHRAHASTVTMVTGHEDPAKDVSSIDLQALVAMVRAGGTACFYMGGARIGAITARLAEEGLAPQTPVAVVQSGTLPSQRCVRTTLQHAACDAAAARLGSPAIIVVGTVAGIDEPGLQWFTRRALFGQVVVIPRTRLTASRLGRRLGELGALVLEAPTIRREPAEDRSTINDAVHGMSQFDWMVLSGVSAVSTLADRLPELGLDSRHLYGVRVAAVGRATAAALHERLAVAADLVVPSLVAERVARRLAGRGIGGKRILLLRAGPARPTLPRLLQEAGAQVTSLDVYRTRLASHLPDDVLEALRGRRVDWIAFASSTTVRNMVELLGDERALLAHVKVAAIGPATAEAIREAGFEPVVQPVRLDIDGLVQAIVAASTS